MSCPDRFLRQRGVSFIELIMFMVIVGVAVAGVLSVYTRAVGASADPMLRKQMLSIGQALLAEVQAMPMTVCDPDDDPAARTTLPGAAASCTSQDGLGPEGGESRATFDHVNDYHGLGLAAPVTDRAGQVIGPANYSAAIAIVPEALGGVGGGATPDTMESLKIVVTVSHASGDRLVVEGYRTRYNIADGEFVY